VIDCEQSYEVLGAEATCKCCPIACLSGILRASGRYCRGVSGTARVWGHDGLVGGSRARIMRHWQGVQLHAKSLTTSSE
jgi:hypothetical protein